MSRLTDIHDATLYGEVGELIPVIAEDADSLAWLDTTAGLPECGTRDD